MDKTQNNILNRTLTVGENDSAIVLRDTNNNGGELDVLLPPNLETRTDIPLSAIIIARFAEKLADPVWVRNNLLDHLNGNYSTYPELDTK